MSTQDAFAATGIPGYDIAGGLTGVQRDVFNKALKHAKAQSIRQIYGMDANTLQWRSHPSLDPAERELIRTEPNRIEAELVQKLHAASRNSCQTNPLDREGLLPLVTSLKNWLQTIAKLMTNGSEPLSRLEVLTGPHDLRLMTTTMYNNLSTMELMLKIPTNAAVLEGIKLVDGTNLSPAGLALLNEHQMLAWCPDGQRRIQNTLISALRLTVVLDYLSDVLNEARFPWEKSPEAGEPAAPSEAPTCNSEN
ncbi:hypothetical protein FACS189472_08030 [Alphaproteobacteria bacterium]|nr:hypothetical protein FACS189472_08030 [Alphaproteobacteria bacterium]